MELFGKKLVRHHRRRLAIFGATPRSDWRAILAVGILAVGVGTYMGEARLDAIRDAAKQGELRRGGGDALTVSAAAEVLGQLDKRGPSPLTPAVATGTPVAATTSAATSTGR
jgi:hypothetical protein